MNTTNQLFGDISSLYENMKDILFISKKLFERLNSNQKLLLLADIIIHKHVPGNKIKNKILIKRFLSECFDEVDVLNNPLKKLENVRESLVDSLRTETRIRKLSLEEQSDFKPMRSKTGVSAQFLGTLPGDLLYEFYGEWSKIESEGDKDIVDSCEEQDVAPYKEVENNESRGLHDQGNQQRLAYLFWELPELTMLKEFFYVLTYTQSKLFILSVLWNNKNSVEHSKRDINRDLHTFLLKFSDGVYDGADLSCARDLLVEWRKKAKLETLNMHSVDLNSLQRDDYYEYILDVMPVDRNFISTLNDQQLISLSKIARNQKKSKKIEVVKANTSDRQANVIDLEYNEVKALNNMFKDMRSQLFAAGVCRQEELQQMSDKEVVHTYMNSVSFTL